MKEVLIFRIEKKRKITKELKFRRCSFLESFINLSHVGNNWLLVLISVNQKL